ncbi:hypothetical protein [Methylobacterium mesophilicum]|uniref:hypothetical protein n=1 Tax=Methylobacterium mesophilicum TaxID=39956 RepID=UPI0003A09F56|nr:hypothetical protein [Methylobacterium mesophilicum]
MADSILPPSSADQSQTCPVRGEAAAGAIPSRSPVARLIPDPFGLSTPDGSLRLFVCHPAGQRELRVQIRGEAFDVAIDDDARDWLIDLLTGAAR